MTRRVRVGLLALAAVLAGCTNGHQDASPSSPTSAASDDGAVAPTDRARSGGDGTVFVSGRSAFAQAMPSLTTEERRAFSVGNNFFNDNWVTAPASTAGRDGLGPLFNAQSCSSCHKFDGRGQPPATPDDPVRGLLIRLSTDTPDGPAPDPVYGDQFQDRAILDVAPEGRVVITYTDVPGSFADGSTYTLSAPSYSFDQLAYGPMAPNVMVSPRVAPAMFGVGLLEAVDEATVLARSDPDDRDDDGISGRPNRVPDEFGELSLGRFGWKANVATVNQQNASAFHGDLGLTTDVLPDETCTAAQTDCAQAPTGGSPEIDDAKLQRVTFYTRTLAVPARRDVGTADTDAGEKLFTELGCAACHTPEMHTGSNAELSMLSNQTIRPYTDLLLHDMGPGLADGRPDFDASGQEWRTAPLWGIGLVDEVNGHTRFLHDGRARNLEEAVLWHGGEAQRAQRRYVELPAASRRQLIAFLESL